MWTTNTGANLSNRKYRCRKCFFGTDVPKFDRSFNGPYHELSRPYENLSFTSPGNIFKCPLESCSRTNLSFAEFYARKCCESKTKCDEIKEYDDAQKIDHDYMENIMHAHKKLGNLHIKANEEYDNAKKMFENAKEKLEINKDKLKDAEDKIALYFIRTAAAITEGKPIEEDPRLLCKICCEKYNDADRVQCVLLCRHSSCEKCLTALPNKTCPVCREPFTTDQIIKLCN